MPGIFHWICCCCICPPDLPSSWHIVGHIKIVNADTTVACDEDFSGDVGDHDQPCHWGGSLVGVCGDGEDAIQLSRANPPCRWELDFETFGPKLSITGDTPAGAYPTVTIVDLGGRTITISSVVIS